jgi:Predicted methyltransferase (contains TPR repeat)
MTKRHRIQFPPDKGHELSQAEAYFYIVEEGRPIKLRFHDYDKVFARPGLYEQLFYERLKCVSPQKVTELLQRSLTSERATSSELRVLDLGAGNGMMAECLRRIGVSRIVGADIIPEARDAAYRDRPLVYDDYLVADFTDLSDEQKQDLADWSFDCLTTVAALGFGDIPPAAFSKLSNWWGPAAGWPSISRKPSSSPPMTADFRALCANLYYRTFWKFTNWSAIPTGFPWRVFR